MNEIAFGTILASAVALALGGGLAATLRARGALLGKVKRAEDEAEALRGDVSSGQQAAREAGKKSEAAREELAKQKKTLGTHKKRNHENTEELKTLRRESLELRAAHAKLQEDLASERAKVIEAEAARAPAPVQKLRPAPAPVVVPTPAPVKAAPSENAVIAELRTECSRLTEENAKLLHDHGIHAATVRKQKDELGRIQRRVQDLRRIDMMTKNKAELLEDKLNTLKREHYEAISQLAALRGEVITPVRPKSPAPAADA